MKDNKTKEQSIELRAKGTSFNKIAKELKVAKSTLIEWSREFQMEIDNLKAIELEALQEQFYMSKKARIELLGNQVKWLKKELEKRDLSDIPTDKLLDSFNKLINQLKQEQVEIIFKGEGYELEDLVIASNTVKWKP